MPPVSKFIFSEDAMADLSDIATFTHVRWGEAQMDVYLQKIDAGLQQLLAMPEMGRKRDDITPYHRSLAIERHTIYYRIENGAIHISRILHQHVDAPRHSI